MADFKKSLSENDETELILAHKAGDEKAGWKLVFTHDALWGSMAYKAALKNSAVPKDDYLQEAREAALLAIDTFDPDRGCRFSTHACWQIRAAFKKLPGAEDGITQGYDDEVVCGDYEAFLDGQAIRGDDGAYRAPAGGIVDQTGVVRNQSSEEPESLPDERDRPATDYWPTVAINHIRGLPEPDRAIALGLWDQFPPKSQTDLARDIGVNRSTVSRKANRLRHGIKDRYGALYFGDCIQGDGLRSNEDDYGCVDDY